MTPRVTGHSPTQHQPVARPRDRGAALILTIMVMAVLMVLGTTILNVSVNNIGSAGRSRDAARALDAADAGVSQALAHLRRNGGRALSCSPTCPANPWGNKATPTAVDLPGITDQRYRVWVEPVPPTAPTFYRVHSLGLAGQGVRSVQVDVELALLETGLPLGVFARSVQGGGNAGMQRASIYTTGCVYNRSKIDMTGIDADTGLPAAVHSARLITDSNGNNTNCPSTDSKAIHRSGPCNTSAPYDHDALGGPLPSGSPCRSGVSQALYDTYYAPRDLDGNGSIDVNGSYLRDDAALQALFDISDSPLSPAQMEELKAVAQLQGTYYTRADQLTSATQPKPANPHAVMYFDLSATDPGGVVELDDISVHQRLDLSNLSAGDPRCRDESLLVVIDGGNVRFNSNPTLSASVVLTSKAPYGEVIKANGNAGLIGTMFADKINLVGTFDVALDQCFLANLAPSLYTVSVSNYLEVDR